MKQCEYIFPSLRLLWPIIKDSSCGFGIVAPTAACNSRTSPDLAEERSPRWDNDKADSRPLFSPQNSGREAANRSYVSLSSNTWSMKRDDPETADSYSQQELLVLLPQSNT